MANGVKNNKVINYFQESYQELKKVTWPTRNQAIRLTMIVIGFCIVVAMVLGILDFGFNFGYRSLVNYADKVAPRTNIPATSSTTRTPPVQVQNIETTPASNQKAATVPAAQKK